MSQQQIFLAQVIGENYKSWNRGDIILLDSPTGTGKTSFCINLALDARISKERILYITSRIAKLDEFKNDTIEFADVFVYTTYQKLEQNISCKNASILNKYLRCKYIFIDECHYFTSDIAMPDSNASLSEEWLRTIPEKSIRIYASATADGYFRILRNSIDIPEEHIFTIQKDYSYVKECFVYQKEDAIEILHSVLEEEPSAKILFFVNNTNRMEELFVEFGYYVADYLCSSTATDTYLKKICNITSADLKSSGIINKRILFATKTIDIGINIKDCNLKYIICEMQDPATIIQCLGRKRPVDATDTCTFFICNQDAKSMALHNINIKKHIEAYEEYRNNPATFVNNHKYDRNLNKGGSVFILTPGNSELQIDYVKLLKYKFDVSFYESVKRNGFIESLKQYLDDYLAHIITPYSVMTKSVIDFLIAHENKKLFEEDKKEISNYFSSIIKGERTFGLNVINRWLNTNIGNRYTKRLVSKKETIRNGNDKHATRYWILQ